MGIAFLGIGLAGDRSPLLGLLWGNILFVRADEAALLGIVTVGLLAFLATSGRMLDALVFARRSETYAFDPRYLLLAFMSLASFVITLNLQFVGGLLIYALLTNPAAAAYELGESMRSVRWLAVGFGLSSTGGLVLSWIFDLPTGACVVLLSTVCYAFAYAVRMRRARSNVLQTAI
jgi:manganese/iron transport system permease protein